MQKNIVIKIILLFTVLQLAGLQLFATHNRAGEITYEQIGTFKYRITLITYTLNGAPADRANLDIEFGDGTSANVPRIEKITLSDRTYFRNKYVVEHTYPGAGTYTISMEDPNRNEGVKNIPGSVGIRFAVKTILQINPNLGANNTPIMLNAPIDKAAIGRVFIHNPNAYDPDGDSLSFKMAVCLGDNAKPIKDYSLPKAKVSIKVDPISGDLIWNYPETLGIYNVAMEIEEWRNGVKIGSIIRDMQIEVVETDNKPPKIEKLNNYCVEADSTLNFTVKAYDTKGERIHLSSTGGVYNLDSYPAKFIENIGVDTVRGQFYWHTDCSHVRKQPYLVIFKAEDNNPDQILVDYENVNVRVVGPAPRNLELVPTNNTVLVKWKQSRCEQVKGYMIYRKNKKTYFKHDSCELGVPEYLGYRLVGTVEGGNTTQFIDNDDGYGLAQGFEYCYMVVAYYADGAESYASEEICTELSRGVPIMLQTSVSTTDEQHGAIHLKWMEPLDFDSIANPGPYRYQIYTSDDLIGASFHDPIILNGLHTVNYIDTNYNTLKKPRIYKMGLFNYDAIAKNWNLIGVPGRAASLFIELSPKDNQVDIKINENVPWDNEQYIIYRKSETETDFTIVDTTKTLTYSDKSLKNGIKYCYKVKSKGKYGLSVIPHPLYNFSQEACAIPLDTVPPCSPKLSVKNNCDSLRNELTWTNPNNSCANDVIQYNIYYTNQLEGKMKLIKTIKNPDDTTYWHLPEKLLGACYTVTAVDSFQNESSKAVKTCADYCGYYSLPNTFTPNGDGINDIFKPYPYQGVERIDMKIYNRWGTLVYQTTDPDINWSGRNSITKQYVSSGVYYYVCDVWENRLTGVEARNLSGFIQVFSGKGGNLSD